MRIISKHQDYYDGIGQYSPEPVDQVVILPLVVFRLPATMLLSVFFSVGELELSAEYMGLVAVLLSRLFW